MAAVTRVVTVIAQDETVVCWNRGFWAICSTILLAAAVQDHVGLATILFFADGAVDDLPLQRSARMVLS